MVEAEVETRWAKWESIRLRPGRLVIEPQIGGVFHLSEGNFT
jgi:hypothetical protein